MLPSDNCKSLGMAGSPNISECGGTDGKKRLFLGYRASCCCTYLGKSSEAPQGDEVITSVPRGTCHLNKTKNLETIHLGILPSNFVSTVPIPVVKYKCQNQHRLLDVMDSLPNTFLSREHGYALRNELALPSEGLFYLHFQHLQSGLVCSSILSEICGWKLEVNSNRLGTCQCGQLSGLN